MEQLSYDSQGITFSQKLIEQTVANSLKKRLPFPIRYLEKYTNFSSNEVKQIIQNIIYKIHKVLTCNHPQNLTQPI